MRRTPARLALCFGMLALCGCSTAASGHAQVPRTAAPTGTTRTQSPTRSATPTDPPHPVILGLGDSVTTGSRCGCTDFIHAYAADLPARLGGRGRGDNEGVSGQTAAQLAQELARGDQRTALARAGTVIVTIGANDLTPLIALWEAGRCDAACGTAQTPAVGQQVGLVLRSVRAQSRPGTRVLVTGYWNVFEDGAVGAQLHGDRFADWSDQVTRSLNAQIISQAAAYGATYVDIYAPFEGAGDKDPTDLLADDGDHPNAAGERLITAALLAATT